MPTKAHSSDAGFDLVATSISIDEFGCYVYGTGLAFEIPEGYVGLVFPRSSIAKKLVSLSNAVGVIDSGYRGEVMAKFRPAPGKVSGGVVLDSNGEFVYHVGDRIAQLVFMKLPDVQMVETLDLWESDRGTGGYGSTGM